MSKNVPNLEYCMNLCPGKREEVISMKRKEITTDLHRQCVSICTEVSEISAMLKTTIKAKK